MNEAKFESLLKKVAVENDFDAACDLAFQMEDELDAIIRNSTNLLPNVQETRRILEKCKVKFLELGLWIIVKDGSALDYIPYDELNSCYDALEKSDLFPYYGHGLKFDMFLEMATYMEK